MSQKPAESTESAGGTYIYETRYFNEGSSHSDYAQVQRTSTFGDPNELWGETALNPWVPADVNSPEFAVAFRFTPASRAIVTVHAIRVTVHYELAGSKGTVSSAVWNGLRGVTRKGPLDVCVGVEGRIFTSDDAGASWTARTSNVTNDLLAVDYRSGEYVAVGRNGTVTTSSDGITWARQSVSSPQDFFSVLARTGKLVLGGTNEELLQGATIATLSHGKSAVDIYVDPEA